MAKFPHVVWGYLNDEQYEAVVRRSELTNKSVSRIVRSAIQAYLVSTKVVYAAGPLDKTTKVKERFDNIDALFEDD